MTPAEKAEELRRLHTDPELLVLVNVWDVISAQVVAAVPGTKALATASHSIAAAHGFEDGERIPLKEMIAAIGRIADAVDLPVSADLEGGYFDVELTVRMAIGAGAVGGNLEDRMRPLPEAVAGVAAAVKAGQDEGVPFVLNARTDAFLKGAGRDPEDVLADAVERGRAFLDAGADCVFVPGKLDLETIGRLVEALGERTVSVIGVPGSPTAAEYAQLGVARMSVGPWAQRAALTALADLAGDLLSGGGVPTTVRALT
jgi:2-methylisocitrate lyase-like PEP mutase family enzyme